MLGKKQNRLPKTQKTKHKQSKEDKTEMRQNICNFHHKQKALILNIRTASRRKPEVLEVGKRYKHIKIIE